MPICLVHAKEIVIVDDWQTHFSEPVRYRLFWPTGLPARDFPELVLQPARFYCGGLYRVGNEYVELKDGPHTTAVHCEEQPLPKPRWAKTYRNGRWRRSH